MCHRFTMLTHDETQDVVRALSYGTAPVWEPDWPVRAPRVDAFPGSCVGIIVPTASGGVEAVEATWGFTAPWAKRPVFNTRIETALSSEGGMWSRAIAQGRCIVPAARFFETQNQPDASDGVAKKRRRSLYSFGMPDDAPVLLAGVQQDGCFSVVTTQPNASVVPVHDRMPRAFMARGMALARRRIRIAGRPRSHRFGIAFRAAVRAALQRPCRWPDEPILSFRHRRSVS